MCTKKICFVLFMVFCSCSLLLGADPNIWDFNTDMAFVTNPNGDWSYGAIPGTLETDIVLGYSMTLYATVGTYNGLENDKWWVLAGDTIPGGNLIPCITKNYGNAPNLFGNPLGMTSLQGGDFPGTSDMFASVARWTAPADFPTIYINGTIFAGDTGATSNLVVLNGESTGGSALISALNSTIDTPISLQIDGISAGDTIDFIVGMGNDGLSGDMSPLEVVIGTEPEPNEGPVDDPDATSQNLTEEIQFVSNPTLYWSYGKLPVPIIDPETIDPNNPPARLWDVDNLDTTELILFNANAQGAPPIPVPWWFFDETHPEYNNYFLPCVFKNTSAGDVYGCPPGMVCLQGGHENLRPGLGLVGVEDLGVIRWTSNRASTFSVSGTFHAGAPGRCDYFIIKNHTTQLLQTLDTGKTQEFSLYPVELNAGDTLDFVVGAGTDGGTSDNTPFELVITDSPSCQDVGIYLETDLNKDCYINLEDFALLADDWLLCNDPANPTCTE